MADIIDIANFRPRDQVRVGEDRKHLSDGWSERPADVTSGALAETELLYVDSDDELSSFLRLANAVDNSLKNVDVALKLGQRVHADELFMGLKQEIAGLFKFRGLSDSIGLIVMRCAQTATQVMVITDHPGLPTLMSAAIQEIRQRPFMKFGDACAYASEIAKASQRDKDEGLADILNAILGIEELDQSGDFSGNHSADQSSSKEGWAGKSS